MIYTSLYITRDADGDLAGHLTKPKRLIDMWRTKSPLYMSDYDVPDDCDKNLREEIRNLSFEDKPIKVEVILKISKIEKED